MTPRKALAAPFLRTRAQTCTICLCCSDQSMTPSFPLRQQANYSFFDSWSIISSSQRWNRFFLFFLHYSGAPFSNNFLFLYLLVYYITSPWAHARITSKYAGRHLYAHARPWENTNINKAKVQELYHSPGVDWSSWEAADIQTNEAQTI